MENTDSTEDIRRAMVAEINQKPNERLELEAQYGGTNVWDTKELQQTFEVLGFLAPFCFVRRKSDNVKGTVLFSHMPRYYFNFRED